MACEVLLTYLRENVVLTLIGIFSTGIQNSTSFIFVSIWPFIFVSIWPFVYVPIWPFIFVPIWPFISPFSLISTFPFGLLSSSQLGGLLSSSPFGKRQDSLRYWNLLMIFNMDSCRNLLVLPSCLLRTKKKPPPSPSDSNEELEGQSETANRRRTDSSIPKRKGIKGHTTICKIYINLKIE